MFPYKKIFSPRKFLPILETKRFSWEILVASFVALIVSVVVSSLTFASFHSFFAVRHLLTSRYIIAIVVLGIYALIRLLVVRFVVAWVVGYLLTEFSPNIKRAGVSLWRIVNTYFYALFLVTCGQIVFFILGGIIATVSAGPLYVIGWIFSRFFDVAAVIVAAQWIFRDMRGHVVITKEDTVLEEGEVVRQQEHTDT